MAGRSVGGVGEESPGGNALRTKPFAAGGRDFGGKATL
jgi:hypothetical protein